MSDYGTVFRSCYAYELNERRRIDQVNSSIEPEVSIEQLRPGGIGFLIRTFNKQARTIADKLGARRTRTGIQLIKRKHAATLRSHCELQNITATIVLKKASHV